MSNAFIPRDTVHNWSEDIGNEIGEHQAALTRLLKNQRRLTRFIERNQQHLAPGVSGVSVYLTGVVVRMFDLAGGRLKAATWDDIHRAEAKVKGQVRGLLPVDDGFADRFRAADRAQPHILDEAFMALFEADRENDEVEVDDTESLKMLLMLWVIVEVLDANWTPAKGFEGESDYTYVHIDPPKPQAE